MMANSPRFTPEIGVKNPSDLHFVAILSEDGTHGCVFRFDNFHESADQALRLMGEFAGDKSIDFTWYDAAVLSQRIRKMKEVHAKKFGGIL